MQILIAILALSFLIIVHEFGHFIVAKLSGIKVLEFSLFMGPKLFAAKKGETIYSVRAIPLGGFVRMEGEEQESQDDRAFNKKPILVRCAVIIAGPLMNLITAVIFIALISMFAGYSTTTIRTVAKGSPAEKAGIQQGDVMTKYDGKSIYHRMDLLLFLNTSKANTVEVELKRGDERLVKTLTPAVIPAQDRYILGFKPVNDEGINSNKVEIVYEGYPGQKGGLQAGDKIVAINGTPVSTRQEIADFLNKNGDKAVDLTVKRDAADVVLNGVVPYHDKSAEGYDVGLEFQFAKGGNLATIIKSAAAYSYSISRGVYYSLAWLIERKVSVNQLMGPVGIVSTIGDVVQQSPTFMDKLINLMNFTALISINLGLFNLIPFPALDGSKLVILAIEGIRRKSIPPEKEALISMVGLVLLIMLMIFATSNDVIRLFTGG